MKLYPALKDPAMLYPRTANALLDAGMVATILAATGLLFVVLSGGGNASLFEPVLAVFCGGVACVFVGSLVSKIRRPSNGDAVPTLRRIK